ncbi:MAG: pirin family protein [Deltaproteobacteria bacterium]|nr:MAG: pirin family protein [Deltaproteobacteria bacterium]
MSGRDSVIEVFPLGFPWRTFDPFLFCVHHDDAYPAGTPEMGVPPELRRGRRLGMDFETRDGFRMYHGESVPGFPTHPHRGFETVTLVRHGYIDHSDSLGAAARFGHGDVQWITAGAGIVHSEMFPLVNASSSNRTELFQIWLNLPRADKMAPAHFQMHWAEQVPRTVLEDAEGRKVELTVVAGRHGALQPQAPPPHSWAHREENDVAIWTLKMQAGSTFEVPAARPGTNRALYLFVGSKVSVGGREIQPGQGARVRVDEALTVANTGVDAELLMLQGRPIGEPVVQHGPFVMTTEGDIRQAMIDYQETRFGGWPWADAAPVHPRERGRFAVYPDGREEEPG